MKQVIRPYILIFSGLIATSCAVFKSDSNRQMHNIQDFKYENADGQFVNYPSEVQLQIKRDLYPTIRNYEYTLWTELTGEPQYTDSIYILKEQKVILDFVSNRKVSARLYYQGELLKEKVIKGHIKDRYFYYRGSFIVIPFFPLYYNRNHHRYRLGLDSENSLVIDNTWNYWMFALFAGDYSKGQRSSKFKPE